MSGFQEKEKGGQLYQKIIMFADLCKTDNIPGKKIFSVLGTLKIIELIETAPLVVSSCFLIK